MEVGADFGMDACVQPGTDVTKPESIGTQPYSTAQPAGLRPANPRLRRSRVSPGRNRVGTGQKRLGTGRNRVALMRRKPRLRHPWPWPRRRTPGTPCFWVGPRRIALRWRRKGSRRQRSRIAPERNSPCPIRSKASPTAERSHRFRGSADPPMRCLANFRPIERRRSYLLPFKG